MEFHILIGPEPDQYRVFQGRIREDGLTFLRDEVRQNWPAICDAVSDNFRIIRPENFRIVT